MDRVATCALAPGAIERPAFQSRRLEIESAAVGCKCC